MKAIEIDPAQSSIQEVTLDMNPADYSTDYPGQDYSPLDNRLGGAKHVREEIPGYKDHWLVLHPSKRYGTGKRSFILKANPNDRIASRGYILKDDGNGYLTDCALSVEEVKNLITIG